MIPLRVPFHQTIQCITSQESNESRNMCIAATDSTEAPAVLIKPTDSTTKKAVCRRSLLVSAGASLAIQICGHMLFPYPSLSLPSLNETLAKFVELPDSGGVKFLDLRLGSGSTPVDGDQVSIHYYGRLAAKQGWRFDSTYDHKDSSGEPLPFVFILGSGKVISGIESAVRSIKVGGIRRVIIPPSQGYQSTTQEPLPPNFFDRQRLFTTIFNPTRLGNGEGSTLGTLIFDIELVNVRS